eukprot:COSAG03_NODE_8821_length_768_cov_1.633782_1_plen_239_part_01
MTLTQPPTKERSADCYDETERETETDRRRQRQTDTHTERGGGGGGGRGGGGGFSALYEKTDWERGTVRHPPARWAEDPRCEREAIRFARNGASHGPIPRRKTPTGCTDEAAGARTPAAVPLPRPARPPSSRQSAAAATRTERERRAAERPAVQDSNTKPSRGPAPGPSAGDVRPRIPRPSCLRGYTSYTLCPCLCLSTASLACRPRPRCVGTVSVSARRPAGHHARGMPSRVARGGGAA